jgi:hypothetical protein
MTHSEEVKSVFPNPNPDLVEIDDDEDPAGINIRREAKANIDAMEMLRKRKSEDYEEEMVQFSYCDGTISITIEGKKEKVDGFLNKSETHRHLWKYSGY